MLWKSKSSRGSSSGSRDQSDLFTRVKADIPTMRQQGAPPEKDPATFSRFQCDLCNSSFPLSELRQCTLCGRWACPSCWTDEYYICNSCHGIVRLHLIPVSQKGKPRE